MASNNIETKPAARQQVQILLESTDIENNKNLKGELLYILANTYKGESPFKALENFKLAVPFLESEKHNLLSNIYFEQARLYNIFSEFPKALTFALKSLEYNKVNNAENNIQRDMSYIGYIHDRMYEFRESIKWNREALKIAEKLKDTGAIAKCYGRIGIAYDEIAEKDNFNEKLFDSALYYNNKAAKLALISGNLSFARTTYSNIGNSYSKLKNYDKAEEYTLKSLDIPGFEGQKGVTLVNLGKIYLETGRYEKAKKILDSAMQNTIAFGTRKYQLEAFYRFHELDVKKGDYKNALKNYIEYKSIEDSLLNQTKTKQIADASERYKSAEKERQILIQRAELAEQGLTIQQRNYQLYGLAGLALIMGMLGYLFYNQQKLKNKQLQKENELKDALLKIETQNKLQEQRLRISRDLHDNIGAQLTFIISSLDNLKYGFEVPDKLEAKLHSISEFTSSTIYELRDTIWAMNKSEITFEDLHSRISNFIDKAKLSSEGILFNFNVNTTLSSEIVLSSVQGMNVYRIIQEAIHNSIKYSEPKNIKVSISPKNKDLAIEISDDGKGFNQKDVELGNGINNMKKRSLDLNAGFLLDSKIGSGTIIQLLIPINT